MRARLAVAIDPAIPYLSDWLRDAYGDRVVVRDLTNARHSDVVGWVVRSGRRVGPGDLAGTRVGLVHSATAGHDHLDVAGLRAMGVVVGWSPGCNARAVVEWVIDAIYLARRAGFAPRELPLGIVGYGAIGQQLARQCERLGWEWLASDPPLAAKGHEDARDREFQELDALLDRCGIVSVHVPLTWDVPHSTRGMLNESRVDRFLGRDGLLINAARGEVLDVSAPWGARPRNDRGRMILDVWPGEPQLPWSWCLADNPVLVASPHVAGYSARGKWNASVAAWRALSRYLESEHGIERTLDPVQWSRKPPRLAIELPSSGEVDDAVGICLAALSSISDDQRRLRHAAANPSIDRGRAFRDLRSGYSLRPEFGDCRLELGGGGDLRRIAAIEERLRQLGFRDLSRYRP